MVKAQQTSSARVTSLRADLGIMLYGFPSFSSQKSPNFADAVTISNLSPGMFKFQLTVTDDAGQTDSAEVSVLVLTPEQSLREYTSFISACFQTSYFQPFRHSL